MSRFIELYDDTGYKHIVNIDKMMANELLFLRRLTREQDA